MYSEITERWQLKMNSGIVFFDSVFFFPNQFFQDDQYRISKKFDSTYYSVSGAILNMKSAYSFRVI